MVSCQRGLVKAVKTVRVVKIQFIPNRWSVAGRRQDKSFGGGGACIPKLLHNVLFSIPFFVLSFCLEG